MKYLILLVFLMAGCSDNKEIAKEFVENKIRASNSDSRNLSEACIRLGKCMGGKYELHHLSNQPHAPYACYIRLNDDRVSYFYPEADISFGDLYLDQPLKSAIRACEMLKRQGEYSDESIAAWKKWASERANKPKPTPTPEQIKVIER